MLSLSDLEFPLDRFMFLKYCPHRCLPASFLSRFSFALLFWNQTCPKGKRGGERRRSLKLQPLNANGKDHVRIPKLHGHSGGGGAGLCLHSLPTFLSPSLGISDSFSTFGNHKGRNWMWDGGKCTALQTYLQKLLTSRTLLTCSPIHSYLSH